MVTWGTLSQTMCSLSSTWRVWENGGENPAGELSTPQGCLGDGAASDLCEWGGEQRAEAEREGSGEGLGPCAMDGTLGVPLRGTGSRRCKEKPEGVLGATGWRGFSLRLF